MLQELQPLAVGGRDGIARDGGAVDSGGDGGCRDARYDDRSPAERFNMKG